MKIAILGAQGTGKTWLASALASKLPEAVLVESVSPLDASKFNLTLLMGLDLMSAPGHVADAARRKIEEQDTLLRAQLARAGISFHVVYGAGPARMANALAVINRQAASFSVADNIDLTKAPGTIFSKDKVKWHWSCDKCSDPDCEHRLFAQLVRR